MVGTVTTFFTNVVSRIARQNRFSHIWLPPPSVGPAARFNTVVIFMVLFLFSCHPSRIPVGSCNGGARAYARNLRLRPSQAQHPPLAQLPALPSETAHQASLRLDAQFPWLAAAFAPRFTRRASGTSALQ